MLRDRAWPAPVLIAALLAGASYWPASHILPHDVGMAAWKGAGVGLLALWAAFRARGATGWLLVAVLAFGAAGDVLLELAGQTIGAATFLVAHLFASLLYYRERRRGGGLVAVALAIVIVALAYAFTRSIGVFVYASALGAMVGSAWASRFPRSVVGTGALLFALSDLLIFARMGPLAGSPIPGLLVWPTYFAGQALIAWGVSSKLVRRIA